MPEVIFVIMQAMANIGIADRFGIEAETGYHWRYFYRNMPSIFRRAWVYRPCWGYYALTERGKIALAIEMGRRTKARAAEQGMPGYRRQKVRDFVDNPVYLA